MSLIAVPPVAHKCWDTACAFPRPTATPSRRDSDRAHLGGSWYGCLALKSAKEAPPMTDYSDFIRDFPVRCGEVLEFCYEQALTNGREVTLLMMTAAAAFVPYERMRSGSDHPSRDRQRFPRAAQNLDSALGKPFLKSQFHSESMRSWSMGRMRTAEPPVDLPPLTNQTPANQVFAIMRNAFAHGNLWTRPGNSKHIGAVAFLAEDKDPQGSVIGYKYINVSTQDFHSFLVKWFVFLKQQRIPAEVVAEALARAA
jgi:hypothetical protein